MNSSQRVLSLLSESESECSGDGGGGNAVYTEVDGGGTVAWALAMVFLLATDEINSKQPQLNTTKMDHCFIRVRSEASYIEELF